MTPGKDRQAKSDAKKRAAGWVRVAAWVRREDVQRLRWFLKQLKEKA